MFTCPCPCACVLSSGDGRPKHGDRSRRTSGGRRGLARTPPPVSTNDLAPWRCERLRPLTAAPDTPRALASTTVDLRVRAVLSAVPRPHAVCTVCVYRHEDDRTTLSAIHASRRSLRRGSSLRRGPALLTAASALQPMQVAHSCSAVGSSLTSDFFQPLHLLAHGFDDGVQRALILLEFLLQRLLGGVRD